MSTVLEVAARISAIDNLTGGLRKMAAEVTAIQTGMLRAGPAMMAFGAGTAAMVAAPAAGIAYWASVGQADLDRALRQFQVVGTATEDQRKQMGKLADVIGPKLAMPQLELIKSAQDLLQAGLSTGDLLDKGNDGVTLMEKLAGGAKAAGEALGGMATNLVTVATAFNMPMGTSAEKIKSLTELMGGMAVAPRLSPDTASTHARALAEFGPIAGQLGMKWDEASAVQNVLSSAGFTGSRGGMAMKTILQRMLNPTTAAAMQMSLNGFDYGRVFKGDMSGVKGDELRNMLLQAGVDIGDKATSAIDSKVAKGLKGGDLLAWKGQAAQDVISAMQSSTGKKVDTDTKKLIKKGIDNVVAAKSGGIDMIAFLEELGKMPVAAFKDLAGLHHASKAAVLKTQESLLKYKANLERLHREGPTAIDDGVKIMTDPKSISFQADRFGPSMQAARNAIWGQGLDGAAASALGAINNALLGIANTDPATLKAIGDGMFWIGTAGAGLFAAGAAVTAFSLALKPLAMMLRNPALMAIMGVGGLAATAAVKQYQPKIENEMSGFEQPSLGEKTWAEFSGIMDKISSAAGSVTGVFAALLGLDVEGSALMTGLRLLHSVLSTINAAMQPLKLLEERAAMQGTGYKGLDDFLKKSATPLGDEVGKRGWERNEANALGSQPVAKLEGQATVSVNVKVEGGQVTSIQSTDTPNLKMKTGSSMPDTLPQQGRFGRN